MSGLEAEEVLLKAMHTRYHLRINSRKIGALAGQQRGLNVKNALANPRVGTQRRKVSTTVLATLGGAVHIQQ